MIGVEEEGDELMEMKERGRMVVNGRFLGDIVRKVGMDRVEIVGEDWEDIVIK